MVLRRGKSTGRLADGAQQAEHQAVRLEETVCRRQQQEDSVLRVGESQTEQRPTSRSRHRVSSGWRLFVVEQFI